MNFLKRFRSYLIGVGLGMLMVVVIFKDKANLFTSWLPENRVLQELTDKKINTTPKTACILKCLGRTETELQKNFLSFGAVEFSNSKTQATPKEYCVMQDVDGVKTCLMITVLDSTSILTEIKSDKTLNCGC